MRCSSSSGELRPQRGQLAPPSRGRAATRLAAGALGVELHLAPHRPAGAAQQHLQQPVGALAELFEPAARGGCGGGAGLRLRERFFHHVVEDLQAPVRQVTNSG
jgi:hypothetical protein